MITLKNSTEPDPLICQYMTMVDKFIDEKTNFKRLEYRELPTLSEKVIKVCVYISEKDYDPASEYYACYAEEGSSFFVRRFIAFIKIKIFTAMDTLKAYFGR